MGLIFSVLVIIVFFWGGVRYRRAHQVTSLGKKKELIIGAPLPWPVSEGVETESRTTPVKKFHGRGNSKTLESHC